MNKDLERLIQIYYEEINKLKKECKKQVIKGNGK